MCGARAALVPDHGVRGRNHGLHTMRRAGAVRHLAREGRATAGTEAGLPPVWSVSVAGLAAQVGREGLEPSWTMVQGILSYRDLNLKLSQHAV